MVKPYIVTYEFEDGTKHSKIIPAKSGHDAMRLLKGRLADITPISAKEVVE